MIQKKIITVKEAKSHARKGNKIAYSLAYFKKLEKSKDNNFYIVSFKDTEVCKSTSIEEAINEYNSII